MEPDINYINFENRKIESRALPQIPSTHQDAGKTKKCGGRGYLSLMAIVMCFVLLTCVLLLVFIILQHNGITADKDLFKNNKNTIQVFNETINRLQDTYSDLMIENKQLQERFNDVNDELKKAYQKGWFSGRFFVSNDSKTWFQSRQYCRDRGADLVIINSEMKQSYLTSIINGNERVWIGLSDIYQEGQMIWVDNSPLKQGFWKETEPNDDLKMEDCVELVSSTPTLHNWNDIPCSVLRKAICEK